MPRKPIVAAVAAVAVAAAAIVFLSGGDDPSRELRALQADPMATYTPAGGELVSTDEQNEGTTLGKPVAARHARLFVLPAADPERALGDALASAGAAGWTVDEPRRGAVGGIVGQGTRRLPTGSARLALTLFLEATALPDDVRPPALRISLEHLRP